jgi:hypothetical protein
MPARRLPWFLALALASPGALAQAQGPTPPSSGPSLPEVESDEPPPPLVPPARDTRSGHLTAGLGAAVRVPFGNLRQGEAASDLGTGYSLALDLGFGVSRTVVVGAWGNVFDPGSREFGYVVGPFVSYHVVQGMRFDPWILAGLGFQSQNADTAVVKRHFSGIDFAHVALGGDYYLSSGLGLGPWLGFDAGVLTNRPDTNSAGQPDGPVHVGAAVNFSFLAGLRLVLDVPGK